MRVPFLGQFLLLSAGGLALWSSTCFFAPAPRGNPTRQGERLALVPGARWEFDLAEWDSSEGVPMLALTSESQEKARVEVRIERERVEPQMKAFELVGEYMVAAVPAGSAALELTAYEGPSTQGRVYVWNEDMDRYVSWTLARSGGMFGFLVAALCAGLGLLLIWRGRAPRSELP